MNKDKRLIQRIRFLRNSKGWTVRDIQKYTGIPHGTWGCFESGKNKPDYESIRKIVKSFNVTADWLLGFKEAEEEETKDEQESERDGELQKEEGR